MQTERPDLIKWQASLRAIKYALHVLDGPREVAKNAEELVDDILDDLEGRVAEISEHVGFKS